MAVQIHGGIELGKDVVIEDGAIVNAKTGFIGDRTIIRSGARIEGNHVELGTESYLDHGAWIGGGSCWDDCALLKAGCWLHMGWNSQVNIARGVWIGEEVGLGIETKVFTHGAYLPADIGFPAQWASVHIGDRVWLPNAWVNPGVDIDNNVVVAAGSVVSCDLEEGKMYGGVPAKFIKLLNKRKNLIAVHSYEDVILKRMLNKYMNNRHDDPVIALLVEETTFDLVNGTIIGPVTEETERVKNQLRRNGIRFKYYAKNGEYVPWSQK